MNVLAETPPESDSAYTKKVVFLYNLVSGVASCTTNCMAYYSTMGLHGMYFVSGTSPDDQNLNHLCMAQSHLLLHLLPVVAACHNMACWQPGFLIEASIDPCQSDPSAIHLAEQDI